MRFLILFAAQQLRSALFRVLADFEKRREVAALAQFDDEQLHRRKTGVEGAVAIAVAPGGALPGPDHSLDVALYQQLQHRLGSQKITLAGLPASSASTLFGHR